jgi:GT2 family glycosyltransferase
LAASGQSVPAAARWLDWDGITLRAQVLAPAHSTVELLLDGVLFEPVPAHEEFARTFEVSPSGNAQMEFGLRTAGSEIVRSWRVLHGRHGSPGIDQWSGARQPLQPLADAPLPALAADALPPVAIVVPIFNAPQLVEACIASVLRWTQGRARLILVDDASTDPAMALLLARHADRVHVVVHRHARNLGYTRSTNLGIEMAGSDDVVLLNSDTEVGPRWLDRLRAVAYGDAAIGTVTAVSDNAGAFSVPEIEQYCPMPENWSLEQSQRALLQNTGGCLPQLPTGNGFCLYVKRAMFDRVGVLDAQGFPSGYGEENDLCQRAERAGFRHVIAGDVLVRHARSASFGDARRAALGAQGMTVLRARYPDYEAKVGAALFRFERRVLDYRVRRVHASAQESSPRPRILLAGAGARDAALAHALRPHYDCLILATGGGKYRLHASDHLVAEAAMADASTLRTWLARYAVELVHVLGQDDATTNALQAAADWMGVPTVTMRTSILVENAQSPEHCAAAYAEAWASSAAFPAEKVPR